VFCWYKGQPALYIQTDASDVSTAGRQGVNLVPRLANAINAPGGAVDDIYKVANFKQGNIIPSAPIPAGPTNSDLNYTPLWQVTVVTWRPGTTPHILKSEEELFAARDAGLVVLQKTDIVLNCPVIYTPFGGQLQTVKIGLSDGDKRDRNLAPNGQFTTQAGAIIESPAASYYLAPTFPPIAIHPGKKLPIQLTKQDGQKHA
jgi:hypothetical protein